MSIRNFVRGALCVGAGLLLAAVALDRAAIASTLYTYSFTQDVNYRLDSGFIYPATFSGGFSGTATADGHISLDTLTDFHLHFDDNPYGSPGVFYGVYSGLPDYFSFLIRDTTGGAFAFQSPLDHPVLTSITSTACVGAAVAALCNGGTARCVVTWAALGIFARGDVAPVVTLVSTSTVATTPIPGALLLMMTALSGLGAVGAMRRKAQA